MKNLFKKLFQKKQQNLILSMAADYKGATITKYDDRVYGPDLTIIGRVIERKGNNVIMEITDEKIIEVLRREKRIGLSIEGKYERSN